jgi:hypothetical protein
LPLFGNDSLASFFEIQNHIIHELGHVFNNAHSKSPMNGLTPAQIINRDDILVDSTSMQFNRVTTGSEPFADFFVAWTRNAWGLLASDFGAPETMDSLIALYVGD